MVHRSESRELQTCVACGGPVDTRESAFGFGSNSVLCFQCALERGGRYDAAQDRWDRLPDVSDLAEPER